MFIVIMSPRKCHRPWIHQPPKVNQLFRKHRHQLLHVLQDLSLLRRFRHARRRSEVYHLKLHVLGLSRRDLILIKQVHQKRTQKLHLCFQQLIAAIVIITMHFMPRFVRYTRLVLQLLFVQNNTVPFRSILPVKHEIPHHFRIILPRKRVSRFVFQGPQQRWIHFWRCDPLTHVTYILVVYINLNTDHEDIVTKLSK